jgi:hypothetical protein
VERRCGQRGGGLEQHVGVVHVVASLRNKSNIVAAAADSRTREEHGLGLAIGGSPRPRGPAGGPSPVAPSGPSAPAPRRSEERTTSTHHLLDGSDRPDTDSLQRRRSKARLTDSASTLSATQGEDSDTVPWRLQSLLIRGGGAPDVHVSLTAGGGQGPAPVGGWKISPRAVGGAQCRHQGGGSRWAAPESGGTKRASPEQGSWAARRRNFGSAPRCEFPSSEPPLSVLQLVSLANLFSSSRP